MSDRPRQIVLDYIAPHPHERQALALAAVVAIATGVLLAVAQAAGITPWT